MAFEKYEGNKKTKSVIQYKNQNESRKRKRNLDWNYTNKSSQWKIDFNQIYIDKLYNSKMECHQKIAW